MEHVVRDPVDMRLLSDWQRGLPLCPRPFSVLASHLGIEESDVIARLKSLTRTGAVSRVGGVVRPNIVGASTLAAVAVPDLQIDDAASAIGGEIGVNHLYMRENQLNLWFVVTGPDRAHVTATLKRIENKISQRVLDLYLERSYHIDLGFPLDKRGAKVCEAPDAQDRSADFEILGGDTELVQALTIGLSLEEQPFRSLARKLGRSEDDVLDRLEQLSAANIIRRIGVIVRHRALGWRSNAMVVWDVPYDDVDEIGVTVAKLPGITLCYRRKRIEKDWPYNFYCMVHAKARAEALDIIRFVNQEAGLMRCPRQVLFSTRCFKQTGALLVVPKEAA